jgi:hypothetical protein
MIPYFVYMIAVLYYFTYNITNYHDPPDPSFFEGTPFNIFLRSLILYMTLVLLIVEAMQVYCLKYAYFSDKWNWLYLISYTTNLVIIIIHTSSKDHDPIVLSEVTSVACFGLWFNIFYWMRLFESTAFYVLMI